MKKVFLIIFCLLIAEGLIAAPGEKKPKQKSPKIEQQTVGKFDPNQPVLPFAETMPTFEGGGLNDFRIWVQKNVKYPEELAGSKKKGRVNVAFVVEADGQLSAVQAVGKSESLFFKEVERVVLSSPKWTPGVQKGKVVRVRMMVPVDFRE